MRERAKNPLPIKCFNRPVKSLPYKMENNFEFRNQFRLGLAWFNLGAGLFFAVSQFGMFRNLILSKGSALQSKIVDLNQIMSNVALKAGASRFFDTCSYA